MMQPPDLSALPAATPAAIHDLLRRCLIKDPRNRLQSIGDARIAIDAAINDAQHAPLVTAVSSVSRRAGHARVWMGAAAVALIAAITLAVVHFRETPPPAAPIVRFQVPVQGNFMNNPPFELSPDGRFLAYWAQGSGGVQALFIRTLETGESREIGGGFQTNVRAPFWSPDSRFLFYVTGAGLNRLEPSGAPRLVCACLPYDGTINHAGVAVLAFQNGGGLFRLPPSAREPAAWTTPPQGGRQHMFPQFTPDGRRVIYTEGVPSDRADRSYYLVELGEGTPVPRRLAGVQGGGAAKTWSAGSDSFVLVSQDDRLVAQPLDLDTGEATGPPLTIAEPASFWSISANGVLAYRAQAPTRAEVPAWFDRRGVRGAIVGEPRAYSAVALSADGLKLATGLPDQIWLRDLTTDNDVRFTLGLGVAGGGTPIWAPDGSAVVFASRRDASRVSQLYQKSATGAGTESLLVKSDRDIFPNDWSRDGRFILSSRSGPSHMDLHVVPIGRGVQPALTPYIDDPGNQKQGQFSPDGRHVAYASDESGAFEIWVATFPDPSNGKWLISRGGGVEPRWSHDGDELFYFSGQKLMRTAVTASAAFAWSPPTALFDAPIVAGYSNDSHRWQVSPDGKRFLLITPASEAFATPIDVIVNWPGLLQRQRD
jgi:eukaryotic-like serine/threonine-protein kinase